MKESVKKIGLNFRSLSQEGISAMASATMAPKIDYTKEVRFAVVMYGGVSLAIYINGVAQELLRLVKSTAPNEASDSLARPLETKDGKPCGTEWVYRKLSSLVSSPSLRETFRQDIEQGTSKCELVNEPIRIRFMVDVLAGTSAGGINSVYLSKALANDQKIDQLKNLWVNEGDINVLINDSKSLKNTPLRPQRPPQSLLNSQRMYLKLLAALDGMDDAREPTGHPSPLVDELDLYITATDIRGLALPIRLADRVVYERRHRNVFHFKYATKEATGNYLNDFVPKLNPFLAFAARSTSSFPFAFEPVRLSDIRELLKHSDKHRAEMDNFKPGFPLLRRFFQENLTQETDLESVDYDSRSFGDGGYLDNKPFSYATSTLARRSPRVPVDRKLIYIEPSPEHPERGVQPGEKPDAIENVLAALNLPRYETIREDIERVLERNRIIDRVNRITRLIEDDIELYNAQRGLSLAARAVLARAEIEGGEKQPEQAMRPAHPEINARLWDVLGLSDMVGLYGIYYLPYRRLRVAALTDEIATLTARVAGFDDQSDLFLAIRCLVSAWRDDSFTDRASEDGQTLNGFLNKFDLSYRLRRLNFLVAKIDELACLVDVPLDLLKSDTESESTLLPRRLVKRLAKYGDSFDFRFTELSTEERGQFFDLLLYLKCELNQLYVKLRTFGRELRRPAPAVTTDSALPGANKQNGDEDAPEEYTIDRYKQLVSELGITVDHLKMILGATVELNGEKRRIEIDLRAGECLREDECAVRARKLFANSPEYGLPELKVRFAKAGECLKAVVSSAISPTSKRARQLLNLELEPYESDPICAKLAGAEYTTTPFGLTVRRYLGEYLKHFDDYDQISFPIFYQTDVGESDAVEVIRISPEDAPSLIDEAHDARGRKKLAGTKLANFSAFLDAAWRVNDIMWGRLDGAERLITALLPDAANKTIRAALICEAHKTILAEELTPEARADLAGLLSAALVERSAGRDIAQAINRVLRPIDNQVVKQRLTSVMTTCLEGDNLYEFVRDHYEVNREFEPEPTARVLARSTRVIGQMLEDISNRHNIESKSVKWISRVGRILLGLIEVSVPNSIGALLFRHWLKLVYLFEGLLLIGATFVVPSPQVSSFAWRMLALTLAVNFAVLLLRDYLSGKKRWARVGIATLVALLVFLALIGGADLFGRGWSGRVLGLWHYVTGALDAIRSWFARRL